MAHSKSAKKRILQTAVRTERNRYYRTRLKNIVKAVHTAVEAEDKTAANEAFKIANKQIHSLVSKGFIKKTTASRKVSRLHKLVNKVA
ncbi:SSU ribosomal protein S20p [hydrothermal vent metagenome]|uniref:SSU ribosomal protein S20p n=1 Tax=hydrothermal vent metagenome TaxID=652676 RepID=A0A1W1BLB5_9ZZZZ